MKLLALLRHAKSSWDDPALGDFERPLNERGRKAGLRMGGEFRRLELDYDLALVSPAERAAETFALVGERWGAALKARPEPRLYGAAVEDLVALIAETPPDIERLLLVGHNPGFHLLATQLSKEDGSRQRAGLAAKLPTGTLVEIGLSIPSWAEVGVSKGNLVRFLRPRDLG